MVDVIRAKRIGRNRKIICVKVIRLAFVQHLSLEVRMPIGKHEVYMGITYSRGAILTIVLAFSFNFAFADAAAPATAKPAAATPNQAAANGAKPAPQNKKPTP